MKRLIAAGIVCIWAVMPAQAQSCDELWYRRNAIYKDGGYCFKTSRAIRAFGNAGCRYDDINSLPLSANDRAQVAEIVRAERAYGCQ